MKKKVNQQKSKIKMIAVFLVVVFLLLLATIFLPQYLGTDKEKGIVNAASLECVKNSDCIIVRGSCCSCEDGGAPQCIAKVNLGDYTQKLESCSSSGACMGFDCGRISCGCVNNECVGQPI